MVSFRPPKKRRPARPRVEILGVFGSGKTTLAARLTAAIGTHLAEDHRLNPFWGQEEAVEIAGELSYDLFFLLQHGRLAAEPWIPGPLALGLCDWSFAADRLWASMRLHNELEVFDAVRREIMGRVGDPIGYLYLRQPAETIVQRLTARGREPEAPLLADLLHACETLDLLVSTLEPRRVLVCGDDLPTERFVKVAASWSASDGK